MSNPGHDIYDECDSQWELTCHQCFKTISPTRPPVFNPDNCSCAETGTFINGDNHPDNDHPVCHYELSAYHNQAQSSTASSISDACPEGPEHEKPELSCGNTYLPLAPEIGLNEPQHRRSSSSHHNMSYQMRRFLIDQDSIRPLHCIESAAPETRFLNQDMYIQFQRSKKDKNRSKLSYQSSTSGEASFSGGGSNLMVGVGTWDDGGSKGEIERYPMTMSELTLTDSGSEH